MTELVQSSKLGFRLQDFDTTCPITGNECLAQSELVGMYVGNAGQELVDESTSFRDRKVLKLKLNEIKIASRFVDYSSDLETPEIICPTRQAMSESRARVVAVRGLRKLIHRK